MSIPLFFNIEHYTMPQLFYYDKANFFMGTAYGKGFMHQNFNAFFNNAYKDGVIKKRRNFKLWRHNKHIGAKNTNFSQHFNI